MRDWNQVLSYSDKSDGAPITRNLLTKFLNVINSCYLRDLGF